MSHLNKVHRTKPHIFLVHRIKSHLNKVHSTKSQLYFLVFQHISAYTAEARQLSEDTKWKYTCLLDLPSPGIIRSAEWQSVLTFWQNLSSLNSSVKQPK